MLIEVPEGVARAGGGSSSQDSRGQDTQPVPDASAKRPKGSKGVDDGSDGGSGLRQRGRWKRSNSELQRHMGTAVGMRLRIRPADEYAWYVRPLVLLWRSVREGRGFR